MRMRDSGLEDGGRYDCVGIVPHRTQTTGGTSGLKYLTGGGMCY